MSFIYGVLFSIFKENFILKNGAQTPLLLNKHTHGARYYQRLHHRHHFNSRLWRCGVCGVWDLKTPSWTTRGGFLT